MPRAQRLLRLIEVLRRHRFPVSGLRLARELGVSIRTLYRDIRTLQDQGADIAGEAGVGYVLRPGFMLPPLMFSDDEIEALALGMRFVATRGDEELTKAAESTLAKVTAVLPPDLRTFAEASALLVPAGEQVADANRHLSLLREAIRRQRKVTISYRDVAGEETRRTVWPFAVGFFERARIAASWCELRDDFRNFRLDRIDTIEIADVRYPRSRHALLREWQAHQCASGPER